MNILAIDTSGKAAGVCVMQDGKILYTQVLQQGLTHSETMLPLVQKALAQTGITVASLGCIALAAGPGSFTGLRIGMALAKGFAMPGNIPVAPVPTLLATALGSGATGLVVPALDARRGEVYWAAFKCDSARCVRLAPDTAGPVQEIGKTINLCADPPAVFVGDGAQLCYNVYNLKLPLQLPAPLSPNTAKGVAIAAARMAKEGLCVPAAQLAPSYLRLSQAERQRAHKLRGGQ